MTPLSSLNLKQKFRNSKVKGTDRVFGPPLSIVSILLLFFLLLFAAAWGTFGHTALGTLFGVLLAAIRSTLDVTALTAKFCIFALLYFTTAGRTFGKTTFAALLGVLLAAIPGALDMAAMSA